MTYEVEQKFPIADLGAVEAKLTALGAEGGDPVEQVDCYYAHPARDFAETDEALRIRRVGEANWLTYKGPKIDPVTKTRREIELPVAPGDVGAAQADELLSSLGFISVAQVRKTRRSLTLPWEGWRVVAALDEIDQLGTFLELELAADKAQLDPALAALASLSAELDLTETERRSYLELLLLGKGHERR